jgi:SAM-dependent methyltransferase
MERVAENPRVYECVQRLAGVRWVNQRVQRSLARITTDGGYSFLDLGGGTGKSEQLVPPGVTYLYLDIDLRRIAIGRKHGHSRGMVGDATRVPIRDGAVDVVLCKFVAHHLTDEQVEDLLAECARILRPGGALIFLDPVWAPSRMLGRMLWRIDRGSHPRTESKIVDALARWVELESVERFAVFHRYVLCVAYANSS